MLLSTPRWPLRPGGVILWEGRQFPLAGNTDPATATRYLLTNSRVLVWTAPTRGSPGGVAEFALRSITHVSCTPRPLWGMLRGLDLGDIELAGPEGRTCLRGVRPCRRVLGLLQWTIAQARLPFLPL